MVKFFIIALFAIITSCNALSKAASNCRTPGTVKDYSYLDGCGLMIEIENGDILHPVQVPQGFILKDGQRILFSYKVLKDVMSICMVEKAIVEISCIKLDSTKSI